MWGWWWCIQLWMYQTQLVWLMQRVLYFGCTLHTLPSHVSRGDLFPTVSFSSFFSWAKGLTSQPHTNKNMYEVSDCTKVSPNVKVLLREISQANTLIIDFLLQWQFIIVPHLSLSLSKEDWEVKWTKKAMVNKKVTNASSDVELNIKDKVFFQK